MVEAYFCFFRGPYCAHGGHSWSRDIFLSLCSTRFMDRLLRSSFLSNLFAYLKYRYFLQGIEFNEDISMYEDLFSNGQRVFHGVLLDDEGNLIKDNQEPENNCLEDFLLKQRN